MHPILQISAGSVLFTAAYDWQRRLHARRVTGEIPDVLLLLEHPHVYSLGRRFVPEHLLAHPDDLRRRGIEVCEADRGGSITYHGPGQLVAYPVVDLRTGDGRHPDVIAYLRLLEAAILATVAGYGIDAELRPGLTGVWVGRRKLAAIGVNVSRGVSKHGVALNVSTDLGYFEAMVPCGIPGAGVTSMERLLEREVALDEVAESFSRHLGRLLGRRVAPAKLDDVGLEPAPGTRPAGDMVAAGA
ncbi:MAG TPA: lipoyl(octanoyl) transferase LipB [Actinomycetota bacterium]|nr:lipoyl(octanoyl) transferase LipB [Actinomycetota bacterium]